MSNHANSILAANTHSRNKARTDRRLICEFVANMGASGCSDEEIERAIPSIHKNSIRLRRGELQNKLREDGYVGYGFITDELGECGLSSCGKRTQKYHVTAAGLRALGRPATDFCADRQAVTHAPQ